MRAPRRQLLTSVAIAAAVALGAARAAAGPADALATDDPRALDAAVTAIERGSPPDADALFAAARACEERLLDPARALAIYERIVRELPDAAKAVAAARRAERLRAEVGATGQYATEAGERAHLVADAEHLPPAEVVRRGDRLVAAAWPGAPGVARWLGDWLCRHGHRAEAYARYTRFGDADAARAMAACAIEGHDWATAERVATALPAADPADRELRDGLLAAVRRGRARARWTVLAWLALAAAFAGLVASFAEAALRRPQRSLGRALRPPVEVVYLAPVAAVLVAIAFTAHHAIAPAVLQISLAGVAAAWLSGATLELVRAGGRGLRARAVAHVIACAAAAIAAGYLAIVHGGLLDLLSGTVRFGPGS